MRALARVGVLVEVGAVELRQSESVAREMRGSPVQKDADAGVVAAVDKLHEFGGRAVAAGGGEIANRLVAPGTVKGVLHNGKQLDVRVAKILDVGNELIAKLVIGEPAVVVFGDATRGAKMDFVDGDRRFEPIFL